jgi:hypothetical protein
LAVTWTISYVNQETRVTFRERIEASPSIFFLGALVAGFSAGLGAYKAILEIAHLEVVSAKAEIPRKETSEGPRRSLGQWIRAAPPTSCRTVCKDPLTPVEAGQDDGGQTFFVCRAAARRDERPGFNVNANSATIDKCAILSDGEAAYEAVYDCLCVPSISGS